MTTYQEFLLPVLAFVQNGATHTARNLRDGLANQLGLTEDERRETIPSGKNTVLHSRVHWACYHLNVTGSHTGGGWTRPSSLNVPAK